MAANEKWFVLLARRHDGWMWVSVMTATGRQRQHTDCSSTCETEFSARLCIAQDWEPGKLGSAVGRSCNSCMHACTINGSIIYLSIHLSIYLSNLSDLIYLIYLSICLSIYMYIHSVYYCSVPCLSLYIIPPSYPPWLYLRLNVHTGPQNRSIFLQVNDSHRHTAFCITSHLVTF